MHKRFLIACVIAEAGVVPTEIVVNPRCVPSREFLRILVYVCICRIVA